MLENEINEAMEIFRDLNTTNPEDIFGNILDSFTEYKLWQKDNQLMHSCGNRNCVIFNHRRTSIPEIAKFLSHHRRSKYFYYSIREPEEIEKIFFELGFEYYPYIVVQKEKSIYYHVIFEIWNNWNVSIGFDKSIFHGSGYTKLLMSKPCHLIYYPAKVNGYFKYYERPDVMPKLCYLIECYMKDLPNDKNHIKLIGNTARQEISCKSIYYCINGEAKIDNNKVCQGDKQMKQAVGCSFMPFDAYTRITKSPAIIIDTDSMKAISFYEKGETAIPFLLDDHFLSYKLDLDDEYINHTKTSVYIIYKRVVDRLNKKMFYWIDKIESEIYYIPGLKYHLNLKEKEFILEKLMPLVFSREKQKTTRVESCMCLEPCGFNMRSYLDKLTEEGLIIPIKDNEDNVLRYILSAKISVTAIGIFCFIMNAYIAEAYENIGDSAQKEWDWRYHSNYWENKVISKDGINNEFAWRKITPNKEDAPNKIEYKVNGRTLSVTEKFQFRVGYFSKLFSIDPDQLRTLKSYSVSKIKKEGQLQGQNRVIVDLILCVNEKKKD